MATTLTFTGNSADAEKAIARLERKYQDLENKIKNASKSAKSGGSDFVGDMAKWAQGVTGIGSAFDVATKAIGLFKAEYDDLLSRQAAAKDVNVNFGRKAAEMAMNLGAGDDPNKAIEKLKGLSRRSQIPISDLTTIMDTAQAARGPLSDERVVETIEDIAQVGNLSPTAMQPIVGASLDLQRQVPGTTSKQAAAFVMNAGAETHVQDASKFATNVMPGVSGIAAEGGDGDLEYAAATVAAMTRVINDAEGRTSRTAMLQLHYQLKRALPHLNSFKERLQFAQDNPEFAQAFLEGGKYKGEDLPSQDMEVSGPGGEQFTFKGKAASFETKAKPAVQQLLRKDSVGYADQQSVLGKLPSAKDSEASFEERARGVQENPNLSLARTAQKYKVEAELNRLDDTAGASAGIHREGVDDLLKAKGIGDFDRNMIGWDIWRQFGRTREEATRSTLKERILNLRSMARGESGAEKDRLEEEAQKYEDVMKMLGPAEPNKKRPPQRPKEKKLSPRDQNIADDLDDWINSGMKPNSKPELPPPKLTPNPDVDPYSGKPYVTQEMFDAGQGDGHIPFKKPEPASQDDASAALTAAIQENNKLLAENNKLLGDQDGEGGSIAGPDAPLNPTPRPRPINRNGNVE